MTTATTSSGTRPRLTYLTDQHQVPAATRAADLVRLARFIADNTDPAQPLVLTPKDRVELAMALPNTPDDRAQSLLLSMVCDLHAAETADRMDPREAWYTPPEDYRLSADATARAAVEADLKAGPITITGAQAFDILRTVRSFRLTEQLGWQEVQGMRECAHGCKLHVRRRGCVDEYALIHYAGYGCALGGSIETRIVPVKLDTKAGAR